MAKRVSINIGLNDLDNRHYGGSYRALSSCRFDAQDMYGLARGFDERILLDDRPEAVRVTKTISKYSRDGSLPLVNGDLLFVSFSGHGSQVSDQNGDELLDQTWCLYDRQIIDDELGRLWSRFHAGVRILFISDSCHSGTVFALNDDEGFIGDTATASVKNNVNYANHRNAGLEELDSGGTVRLRELRVGVSDTIISDHADIYDPVYRGLRADLPNNIRRFEDLIEASMISISACQDYQKAKDGDDNGVFTAALKSVWNEGAIQGTYFDFHSAIKEKTKNTKNPNQTPKLWKKNADQFLMMRPFQS